MISRNWFLFSSAVGCRWRSPRTRKRASAKPPWSRTKWSASPSSTSQINVGDGLLRDEVVRTGADSAARLVMADSTNLSLGPSATIKLDRTVFNDEHSYRDVAIRMTSGAFRFVTGNSDKAAYKITTPLATIGVRGTTLDILSQRGRTIVVLQEGAASGLHHQLPVHPAHQARRHRHHHLDAAAGPRSRRPTTRPGPLPRPAAPRPGFAAPPNMRMRRRHVDDGSDPTGMLCGR